MQAVGTDCMAEGTDVPSCCWSVSLWGYKLVPQQLVQFQAAEAACCPLQRSLETSLSHGTIMRNTVMLSVWKPRQLRGSSVLAKLSKVGLKPWLAGYVSLSRRLEPKRIKDLAHNFYY